MDNPSIQNIGLLGGSFDPVHNGHLSIARSFIASGYLSELWILLTPSSPHKEEQESADYAIRLNMLSAAFEGQENMLISEVEKNLSPPYYTVHTVKYLTEIHRDRKFYLCMGEDSLVHFHKWHEWKEILRHCALLVARRPSFPAKKLPVEIENKTRYVIHEPVAISSTGIRHKVHSGEDITDFVPPAVAGIIRERNLYQK